jgi:predicted negative regulator of RcsB-dependent stress response
MAFPKFVRAALCALAFLLCADAFAMGMTAPTGTSNTSSRKDADKKGKDSGTKENKYPNATRHEPKVDISSGDQKDLNKAADLVNDGKDDDAAPIVQKVLANDKASKYAQAFAHQLQAQIYYEKDKSADAIAEYKKAVDMDALPNDAHFQVLYQIAQLQVQDEKYADALATLDQWEKQSGAQTADELALKANTYYRTDKFQDAVDTMKKAQSLTDKPNDSWNQILMASYFELNQYDQAAQLVQQQMAKNPNDKKLLNQLATIYIQADKPQQALDLMAKAKSQGLITTSDDYLQLAKLQASAEKYKDASATLKEGLDKNILKQGFDVYKLQGDVCTQAEDDACAIDAYTKASPQSKDGNIDYQLGYLLFYSDRSKDAAEALSRSISKGGLRQEGEAYLLRGDAENDLNQAAAATADWQKASTYPSTKAMADQRLKAAKGGVKIKRAAKKPKA